MDALSLMLNHDLSEKFSAKSSFIQDNDILWNDALLASQQNEHLAFLWIAEHLPKNHPLLFEAGIYAASQGNEQAFYHFFEKAEESQKQTLIDQGLLEAAKGMHWDLMDSLKSEASLPFMSHLALGVAQMGNADLSEYFLINLPPSIAIPSVLTGAVAGGQSAVLSMLAEFQKDIYDQDLGLDLISSQDWKALNLLLPHIEVKPIVQSLQKMIENPQDFSDQERRMQQDQLIACARQEALQDIQQTTPMVEIPRPQLRRT